MATQNRTPKSSPNSVVTVLGLPGSSPLTDYSPELVRRLAQVPSTITTSVTTVQQPFIGPQPPVAGPQAPVVAPQPQAGPPPPFLDELVPTDDGYYSRYLQIQSGGITVDLVQGVADVMKNNPAFNHAALLAQKNNHTTVWLAFDDLIEARNGRAVLGQFGFSVLHVPKEAFADSRKQDVASADIFEGQVAVTILTPFQDFWDDFQYQRRVVYETCSAIGSVRNIRFIKQAQHANGISFTYRVEYHSVMQATRALKVLDILSKLNNDSFNPLSRMPVVVKAWADEVRPVPATSPPAYKTGFVQPTHDAHNRVSVKRILNGQDVRTTVMLRNIPNKMNWMDLKLKLDTICFGSYDFLYLRMDFATQANVGYAFINFADTNGLVDFVRALEFRHWAGFNSSKAIEISYATIQGKEALVAKFRNSSVMQETPNCKPRLFHTDQDSQAGLIHPGVIGTEQDFPDPDNISKLHRSMASASQHGLYPPRQAKQLQAANDNCMTDNGNPRQWVGQGIPAHQGVSHTLSPGMKIWCEAAFASVVGIQVPFAQIPTHLIQMLCDFHAEVLHMYN